MERTSSSPEAFIAALPDGIRGDVATLDRELAAVMVGRERVMWEGILWGGRPQRIIGYGSYRYRNRSGTEVEWFTIGLAAQKRHLSLYVSAVDDGTYLVQRFAPRLGRVKVGSAAVTFRRLADVDRDALHEMLERARDLTGGES